jgi:hypothetical protein
MPFLHAELVDQGPCGGGVVVSHARHPGASASRPPSPRIPD